MVHPVARPNHPDTHGAGRRAPLCRAEELPNLKPQHDRPVVGGGPEVPRAGAIEREQTPRGDRPSPGPRIRSLCNRRRSTHTTSRRHRVRGQSAQARGDRWHAEWRRCPPTVRGLRPSSSTSGPDIQFGQLSLCFAVLTLATAAGGTCLVCRALDYSALSGCSRSVPRRPRIQTTMITMPVVNATVPRTPASTPYGRPVQRVVELPLGARTRTDP